MIDRWFMAFVVLECVAFAWVPMLPLGVAAAAFATPLRASRRRLTALCALGLLLALIVAAPAVIGLLDLQLVESTPAHTAR